MDVESNTTAFEIEEEIISQVQEHFDEHIGPHGLWRYGNRLLWAFSETRLMQVFDQLRVHEREHIAVHTHNRRVCKRCMDTRIAKREVIVPLLYLVDIFAPQERLVHSGKTLKFNYYYCPRCDGLQPSFDGQHVIRVLHALRKSPLRIRSER